jgi:hypothetical protein
MTCGPIVSVKATGFRWHAPTRISNNYDLFHRFPISICSSLLQAPPPGVGHISGLPNGIPERSWALDLILIGPFDYCDSQVTNYIHSSSGTPLMATIACCSITSKSIIWTPTLLALLADHYYFSNALFTCKDKLHGSSSEIPKFFLNTITSSALTENIVNHSLQI